MKTASMGCSLAYGHCGVLVLAAFVGKRHERNVAAACALLQAGSVHAMLGPEAVILID